MKVVRTLCERPFALAMIAFAIGCLWSSGTTAALSGTPAEFSEDGRLVVVQTAEGLAVWDLETRELVGQVSGAQCEQVLLLKQDAWVLCATNAITIYDWRRQTTVAAVPPEGQNPMRVLAYSPETDRMVVRQGGSAVSVWKIGEKLVPLKHIPVEVGKGPASFAASPDAKMLAIAGGYGIHLYDLTGTKTRDISLQEGNPHELLFSRDGSTLAISIGPAVLLIDVADGTIKGRATLTHGEGARGPMTPRVFSRDGNRLVVENGEWSYAVFDAGTGKRLLLTDFLYDDHERNQRAQTKLLAVDVAPDGDFLVGQPEHPGTLRIWDLQNGAILPDLCGEDCLNMRSPVSLLRWSPDGSKIIVGMQGSRNSVVDGKVSVWDVQSRSPELVLDPSSPRATVLAKRATPAGTPAAFSETRGAPVFVHEAALRAVAGSPTSSLIVTAGDDGLLKVWDSAKGLLLRRLRLGTPASALAFGADGAFFAAGTIQGEVRIWDTNTWREVPSYSTGLGPINALHFLPGNRLLAVAGGTPTVSILDLVTRRVVKELSHDGGAGGGRTCEQPSCQGGRVAQGDLVLSIATLEGGTMLLTASRTGRAVWDTSKWSLIENPQGFPDNWSPLGGKSPFLATSARTTDPHVFALSVWDPKRNRPVATLDRFANRDTEVTNNGKTVRLGASLTVDPMHRLVATRIGEYISVWDLSAKAKRAMFHVARPVHLHWTNKGTHLVVSTRDRKVLVWSAETMAPAFYLRDPSVMQ